MDSLLETFLTELAKSKCGCSQMVNLEGSVARCVHCAARIALDTVKGPADPMVAPGRPACFSIAGQSVDVPENHHGPFSIIGDNVFCHNCNGELKVDSAWKFLFHKS